MTAVVVDLRHPGDPERGAAGYLDLRPLRRRTVGDHIVLPSPFTVPLVDGRATVELTPTDGTWCWVVTERVAAGIRRNVLVPDVQLVGYEDLVDVDPDTLAPDPPGVPGWVAALPDAVSEYLTEHPPEQGDPGPEGPQGPEGPEATPEVGAEWLAGENAFTAALDASYVAGIVVKPSGDTTGATDLANLNAAALAASTGAPKRITLSSGVFHINAPWVLPKRLTCHGAVLHEEWVGGGNAWAYNLPGKDPGEPAAPSGLPFKGTIIKQVTPGANVIEGTAAASTHDLRNIVATWATLNVSTGHGFVFDPVDTYGGLPDSGAFGSYYERLTSWGHDGDHYGFSWTNPLYVTSVHLRSYGGGGFRFIGRHTELASGNSVHTNPYAVIQNLGSANGFQFERHGASEGGAITHNVFVRPQVNNGAGATGTQMGWNDLGGPEYPTSTVVIGLDMENAHSNVIGPGTRCTEGTYIASNKTGPQSRYGTAYWNHSAGVRAMGAATSADFTVAVGARALESVTTAGQNTAVGYQAGRVNTAAANTFIGYTAGEKNTTGAGIVAVGRRALAGNVTNSNNTAVGHDSLASATASSNTAIGFQSGMALTTGGSNVTVGAQAGALATTGTGTTLVGHQAGHSPAGVIANATVTGTHNTFVGSQTGNSGTGDYNDATAVGYRAVVGGHYALAVGRHASAGATGAVAIGTDSGGVGAAATAADTIALGTALHKVKISNNATGAASAALGANCPATTATAPFTWLRMMAGDGSTIYVPAWK